MKKLRNDFVNELFNFKGEFERKTSSLKPEVRVEAYVKLGAIFENSKTKMIKLEKQRLARERYFFSQEEN